MTVAVTLALTLVGAPTTQATLVCTATVTQLTEVPGVGVRETQQCVGDQVTLGLSLGAELAAVQVTGHRGVVSVGATPSVGVRLSWRPAGWPKLLPEALGGELMVAVTTLDPSAPPDRVHAWLVGSLRVIGWFALGLGGRFGLATKPGVPDTVDLVVTGGVRVPTP